MEDNTKGELYIFKITGTPVKLHLYCDAGDFSQVRRRTRIRIERLIVDQVPYTS